MAQDCQARMTVYWIGFRRNPFGYLVGIKIQVNQVVRILFTTEALDTTNGCWRRDGCLKRKKRTRAIGENMPGYPYEEYAYPYDSD